MYQETLSFLCNKTCFDHHFGWDIIDFDGITCTKSNSNFWDEGSIVLTAHEYESSCTELREVIADYEVSCTQVYSSQVLGAKC